MNELLMNLSFNESEWTIQNVQEDREVEVVASKRPPYVPPKGAGGAKELEWNAQRRLSSPCRLARGL